MGIPSKGYLLLKQADYTKIGSQAAAALRLPENVGYCSRRFSGSHTIEEAA
ncbi:hypothetical protein H9Q10_00205 [Eikenella sp. S3360]|uniref:Uncharacterized protein n=1 Tax=Eikenella glucosivorans TaxID=2766967 RepID=A0ABS0N717_9NEIS|nr:hypothetical protein [Eikenella glucosivorans]MBH5328099.1 hypothetical protein [Eikenella glucosivorans]